MRSWQMLLMLLSFLSFMAPVCDGDKSLRKDMTLASTAFKHGEQIPVIHTCKGEEQSPPLNWKDVPPKTVSLALVVDDPDAPSGTFVHWIAWNIDPKQKELPGNIKDDVPETQMVQGMNSTQKIGYKGPCPPSGTHHYYFKLYALDTKLDLKKGASLADLENAIKGHVLQETKLMGTFKLMP